MKYLKSEIYRFPNRALKTWSQIKLAIEIRGYTVFPHEVELSLKVIHPFVPIVFNCSFQGLSKARKLSIFATPGTFKKEEDMLRQHYKSNDVCFKCLILAVCCSCMYTSFGDNRNLN